MKLKFLMLAMLCLATAARGAELASEDAEFFERQIRPVLAEHCYECHSGGARRLEGGLRLDSRAAALAGGDSGPALVPGRPEDSLLVQAVRYESFEMPPRGRLPQETVDLLVRWIARGAAWPELPGGADLVRPAFDWRQRQAQHWSWQPIRSVAPPPVRDTTWPVNAVDRFVLARLEAAGLQPAPDADRRTWIRRLYFDLIGLPPSPVELAAALADDSPRADEQLIDDLLASPHFGEKWARHWMDLVRFAETHGHEFDYPIQHAWRYRDYLIRAFNADVPYDQLIVEHLAGDLLPEPRRHPLEGYNESILGTGFWFLGEAVHAPTDVRGDEALRIDNQIDVLGKAFLGLTLACARCHDHKFDPISSEDYYALTGFLQSSRRQVAMLDPQGRIAAAAERLRDLRSAGDRALAASVDRTPLDTRRFAAGLLAARGVLQRLPAAAQAATRRAGESGEPPAGVPEASRLNELARQMAEQRDLDPATVAGFVAALADPAAAESTHPLYAWQQLAGPAADGSVEPFAQRRMRLAAELAARVEQVASQAQTVLFADFDTPQPAGWSSTGAAFELAPTAVRQWDSAAGGDRPVRPGVMHSGLASNRLHGVLRSPTFTITHPAIHYRLNARGAFIRLVIDGYFMVMYHGLLFSEVELKDVDTAGQYAWRSQRGDLGNHLGRTAWLEIVDQGDGFVAIDEIRFSDGAAPQDPPHRLARLALEGDHVDSPERLAEAYGAVWADCLRRWQDGAADAGDVDLIGWASGHGLTHAGSTTADIAGQMKALEGSISAPVYALAITDGTGEDGLVHIRGSHKNLGPAVPRRLPLALAGVDQRPIAAGSGRLELAERIIEPANPFPARVLVNRLWHHLLGRGIVPSVDDFGVMGQPPTHPELLDWLAADFRQHGWSIKHTIRAIVSSRTYRMSSRPGADGGQAETADPANQLLHRMPKRRLPAEAVRDALLAVSGRLDRTQFGPSVPVHLTPFMEGRGRPSSGPLDGDGRRSVYVEVRRNFLPPMMLAFDLPAPAGCIGRRSVSNVPAQALILMNDPFVIAQAQSWAERVVREHATAEERIAAMFQAATAQPPSAAQLQRAREFLQQQARLYGTSPDDVRVWSDLGHTLVNLKEFLYLN